jgi:AcrR family transcriptional regulator
MNQVATTTAERILDAAEHLFAENGIGNTSLRQITAAASVNLAAIHYHFRSKDGLIEALLLRRLAEANRVRLEQLDAAESAAYPPALEKVMHAFVGPVVDLGKSPRGTHFARMMARVHTEREGLMVEILQRHFPEMVRRFKQAFRRAAPGLPPEEILWRIHFSVGLLMWSLQSSRHLEAFSDGRVRQSNPAALTRRLVSFLSAGFRAPLES